MCGLFTHHASTNRIYRLIFQLSFFTYLLISLKLFKELVSLFLLSGCFVVLPHRSVITTRNSLPLRSSASHPSQNKSKNSLRHHSRRNAVYIKKTDRKTRAPHAPMSNTTLKRPCQSQTPKRRCSSHTFRYGYLVTT